MSSSPARPLPAETGRRERTKAQNRELILAAARSVFAEMGYGAATVRDIIRATPLASGTFYNYFKSKEEVYQAIRDDVALALRPKLRADRTGADSLQTFLHRSFHTFFSFVAANRTDFRHLRPATEVRFRMDTPEVIAGFEELREDLDAAMARGVIPKMDSDYLMAAIVGVAFELSERMLRRGGDPGAAAHFATALFLGGLTSLPKTEPDAPSSDGKG